MSHTTKIQSTPIKDVRALRKAVNTLASKGVKIELLQDTAPRMFYEDQLVKHLGRANETCDYVIRLEDSLYDIGLIKNEDGIYEPVFDSWNGHVARQLGVNPIEGMTMEQSKVLPIGQLLQEYTKEATINQAVNEGYNVASCTLNDKNEYILTLAV